MKEGSYLGSEVSDEQLKEIRDGTFRFMPGDYWVINGHKYRICGYLPEDPEEEEPVHHLVILGDFNVSEL